MPLDIHSLLLEMLADLKIFSLCKFAKRFMSCFPPHLKRVTVKYKSSTIAIHDIPFPCKKLQHF